LSNYVRVQLEIKLHLNFAQVQLQFKYTFRTNPLSTQVCWNTQCPSSIRLLFQSCSHPGASGAKPPDDFSPPPPRRNQAISF